LLSYSQECGILEKTMAMTDWNSYHGEEIFGGGESAKQPLLRPPALKSGYLGKI